MSVDDALNLLLSKSLPVEEIEYVEIASALGRILAQAQTSTLNIPPPPPARWTAMPSLIMI